MILNFLKLAFFFPVFGYKILRRVVDNVWVIKIILAYSGRMSFLLQSKDHK